MSMPTEDPAPGSLDAIALGCICWPNGDIDPECPLHGVPGKVDEDIQKALDETA